MGAHGTVLSSIFHFTGFWTLWTSDVDPDPVGSEFIWVRGSGSGPRVIKCRVKQSSTNKVFFSRKWFFFKSEPKKVANIKGLGTDLKIDFFRLWKDYLKSIRGFYWSGSAFIKFCGFGSACNQCGSTSLLWTNYNVLARSKMVNQQRYWYGWT